MKLHPGDLPKLLVLAAILMLGVVTGFSYNQSVSQTGKAKEKTIAGCKYGLKSFSAKYNCNENRYRSAVFTCPDGYSGTLGGTNCTNINILRRDALKVCLSHYSCSPTPTIPAPPPVVSPPSGCYSRQMPCYETQDASMPYRCPSPILVCPTGGVTPTPEVISPAVCLTPPPCLFSYPRCLIPEPAEGWCPVAR